VEDVRPQPLQQNRRISLLDVGVAARSACDGCSCLNRTGDADRRRGARRSHTVEHTALGRCRTQLAVRVVAPAERDGGGGDSAHEWAYPAATAAKLWSPATATGVATAKAEVPSPN